MSNSTTYLCVWTPEAIQRHAGGDISYARAAEHSDLQSAIDALDATAGNEPIQTCTLCTGRTHVRNAVDGMDMATIYEIS